MQGCLVDIENHPGIIHCTHLDPGTPIHFATGNLRRKIIQTLLPEQGIIMAFNILMGMGQIHHGHFLEILLLCQTEKKIIDLGVNNNFNNMTGLVILPPDHILNTGGKNFVEIPVNCPSSSGTDMVSLSVKPEARVYAPLRNGSRASAS